MTLDELKAWEHRLLRNQNFSIYREGLALFQSYVAQHGQLPQGKIAKVVRMLIAIGRDLKLRLDAQALALEWLELANQAVNQASSQIVFPELHYRLGFLCFGNRDYKRAMQQFELAMHESSAAEADGGLDEDQRLKAKMMTARCHFHLGVAEVEPFLSQIEELIEQERDCEMYGTSEIWEALKRDTFINVLNRDADLVLLKKNKNRLEAPLRQAERDLLQSLAVQTGWNPHVSSADLRDQVLIFDRRFESGAQLVAKSGRVELFPVLDSFLRMLIVKKEVRFDVWMDADFEMDERKARNKQRATLKRLRAELKRLFPTTDWEQAIVTGQRGYQWNWSGDVFLIEAHESFVLNGG